MELKEALDYLKTRGFITEDTETNDEEVTSLKSKWNAMRVNRASDKELDDVFWKRVAAENRHIDLKDKISNAKSFNMMSNIKTYEKQFIAKLKELGLTITGSNRDMVDKRLTHYDVEINDKGEREEGFVCLYVEDGELWVNYELFSGISGNDPYEEFINDTLPLEIKNFKKYADEPRYF